MDDRFLPVPTSPYNRTLATEQSGQLVQRGLDRLADLTLVEIAFDRFAVTSKSLFVWSDPFDSPAVHIFEFDLFGMFRKVHWLALPHGASLGEDQFLTVLIGPDTLAVRAPCQGIVGHLPTFAEEEEATEVTSVFSTTGEHLISLIDFDGHLCYSLHYPDLSPTKVTGELAGLQITGCDVVGITSNAIWIVDGSTYSTRQVVHAIDFEGELLRSVSFPAPDSSVEKYPFGEGARVGWMWTDRAGFPVDDNHLWVQRGFQNQIQIMKVGVTQSDDRCFTISGPIPFDLALLNDGEYIRGRWKFDKWSAWESEVCFFMAILRKGFNDRSEISGDALVAHYSVINDELVRRNSFRIRETIDRRFHSIYNNRYDVTLFGKKLFMSGGESTLVAIDLLEFDLDESSTKLPHSVAIDTGADFVEGSDRFLRRVPSVDLSSIGESGQGIKVSAQSSKTTLLEVQNVASPDALSRLQARLESNAKTQWVHTFGCDENTAGVEICAAGGITFDDLSSMFRSGTVELVGANPDLLTIRITAAGYLPRARFFGGQVAVF